MSLTVIDPGALTTVQDTGRPGYAHLGVPRGGALDAPAAALANRILGNPESDAVLEATLAGCALRAEVGHWLAVTGAPCHVAVDGHEAGFASAVWVPAGSMFTVGRAESGVRSYVAVAGGISVPPVLGSRSTDTLAWVGPPAVAAGATLPVGVPTGEPQAHDTPRPVASGALRLLPGPRTDWFVDPVAALVGGTWNVQDDSNRVGLRLAGPALRRAAAYDGVELASEGMVLGAVQVPPDGQPVVFLADHPVTGGYPVPAVVHPGDLHLSAQLRPGDVVSFRRG